MAVILLFVLFTGANEAIVLIPADAIPIEPVLFDQLSETPDDGFVVNAMAGRDTPGQTTMSVGSVSEILGFTVIVMF